jgi:hypothetical protein
VIDPGRLANNNKYEISFADSLNLSGEHVTYAYSVKNTIKDTTYFDSVAVPIDSTLNTSKIWSTTIFDGMTLSFQNVSPNMPYILAHSGWTEEKPENLQVNILKGAGWNTENFTLEVTDAPADFEYKKTNQVYFKIYDNITQDTIPFWLTKDVNSSVPSKKGRLAIGDEITLLAFTNVKGKLALSYKLQFAKPADTTVTARVPQAGDKFTFSTNTPFGSDDKFQFTTTANTTKTVKQDVLNSVSVVPNPYIVAAKWESATTIQGRGEQKLYFNHLPAQCTIRIFTQNGYLIKTLQHSGNIANGSEPWDLTTKDGLNVAFGIYVYHVDAPGVGQKIGTFAVIQ